MSDKREVRPIDANALIENGICVEYGFCDNGLLLIPMRDVINSIRNAPTLDVKHVQHGLWAFSELGPLGCNVKCTECGWSAKDVDPALWLDNDGHKYCGCCGAKMDGEHGRRRGR